MKPAHTPQIFGSAHFVIEGRHFHTAKHAHAAAVSLGYSVEFRVFNWRIAHGANTWAELCAPKNETIATARRSTAQRKRDEMAAVIAALDARKAGLA